MESDGKTNAVKCFNNKLRHPFLEIKIANIAPPYLYILLEITLKHPNLIQKEVQNRDEIIAKQKHSNYRRNWLKAEEKKKKTNSTFKRNAILDDESRRRMWRREAKRS